MFRWVYYWCPSWMFWNMLCSGCFPLKLYFCEWVSSPCGAICKIMLSLLWAEAGWKIKKGWGLMADPSKHSFYRWDLQRLICSAHTHSSRVLGAAGKVLIVNGRTLLLEMCQCCADSSPAEQNSNRTREVWSKNNNKDSLPRLFAGHYSRASQMVQWLNTKSWT